jgi:hypothetical protein
MQIKLAKKRNGHYSSVYFCGENKETKKELGVYRGYFRHFSK